MGPLDGKTAPGTAAARGIGDVALRLSTSFPQGSHNPELLVCSPSKAAIDVTTGALL